MASMCCSWSPYSAPVRLDSLPEVLESSCFPPVPNPILESQLLHLFSLLPRIPILGKPGAHQVTLDIELFPVAVVLQRSTRTNQRLPRVHAVFSFSNQRVQGIGLPVDKNKVDLLADLHTKTDPGERCAPIGS